jgi:hypothetical protein
VLLTDADWVKDLLTKPDADFGRSFESYKTLSRLLGTGIVAAAVSSHAMAHRCRLDVSVTFAGGELGAHA